MLPTGEIVAIPARGTLTGNRGILVDAHGRRTNRRWTHKAWICCVLDWQGRTRKVMSPGQWTELFFLDEAVAMAAGHRPCGYCRRPAYTAFRDAWARAHGARAKAAEMDAVMHMQRVDGKAQRREQAEISALPDGSMCLWRDQPHLVMGNCLLPWTPDGYGAALPRPATGVVTALTPTSLRACLGAGYRPLLHPTAGISR